MKFHHSFLKVLTGSELSRHRLPYMVAEAESPGPTIWLTAGCHGDEVGGMVVAQEVFRQLRKRPLKRGSLHAFPIMNPRGFEAGSRQITMSNEDLNRAFPGSSEGTLAERMAEKIFGTIIRSAPTFVVDLHNDWIRSIPYVVLDPPPQVASDAQRQRVVAAAMSMGFAIVTESTAIRRTLSHSLTEHGVAALTVELGESYVVNENQVTLGVQAVFNVLEHFDVVEPDNQKISAAKIELPADVRAKELIYSCRPLSPDSGILRYLVKPGDQVRAGQPIAKIYNAFGRLQSTLLAEGDALVLGLSDSSVAFPGAPVMASGRLGLTDEKG